MPLSIAIVEDNAEICEELRQIIQETEDLAIVACCRNAASATATLPSLEPDVVLMDIQLPDGSGIEIVSQVKPQLPQTHFVMLTVSQDIDYVFNALSAGAVGYLLKDAPPEEILNALRSAPKGESALSGRVARSMIDDLQRQNASAPRPQARLTKREQQVLEQVALGLADKQIAEALHISLLTVNSHLKNVYAKLDAHSRSEAVARYYMGQPVVPSAIMETSEDVVPQTRPQRRRWFSRRER
ncbi:MAG: LuxR family transcriptional regulator [Puniceicoccaceae bacterium 5H]|nr:MAG: LuxR family transcriptional regulator [Puniceicoccaceae bacterium 5H]